MVAASHEPADIATQTSCCSALAAQQDQREWQAEAVKEHPADSWVKATCRERWRGEDGRCGLQLRVEFSSFLAMFDNYTSCAVSSKRKSSLTFSGCFVLLKRPRRQNGDRLFFPFFWWSIEHHNAEVQLLIRPVVSVLKEAV